MKYHPGELDQLITVKRIVEQDDGRGGKSVSVETVREEWAHVRPRSGREVRESERMEAHGMYLFVLRWCDDIDERNVFEWEGEDYNIRSRMRRGGRQLYVEFDAERGAAL
jgi:SPP1 family predicted phage head-tail adaptor